MIFHIFWATLYILYEKLFMKTFNTKLIRNWMFKMLYLYIFFPSEINYNIDIFFLFSKDFQNFRVDHLKQNTLYRILESIEKKLGIFRDSSLALRLLLLFFNKNQPVSSDSAGFSKHISFVIPRMGVRGKNRGGL